MSKNKQSKRTRAPQIEVVDVHLLYSGTTDANGLLKIALSPDSTAGALGNASSKLSSMSDLFQLFRFTSVRTRPVFVASSRHTVGYLPDITVTDPTTEAQVMALPGSSPTVHFGAALGANYPSNPAFHPIPRRFLMSNQVPWWRTRPSAAIDDVFEYQGFIYLWTGLVSSGVALELFVVCEFKNFVGATQTPSKVPPPVPEVNTDWADLAERHDETGSGFLTKSEKLALHKLAKSLNADITLSGAKA